MRGDGHAERPFVVRSALLRQYLWGVILIAAVFTAYLPCLHGGFVWDDDAWTIHLRPLFNSPGALLKIWTSLTALQQFYPLTGTTFWMDHHLWGEWTTPYHVQNVMWHAIAAVLFWRVLDGLLVPGAWLAGGIFAMHPVMVESVAWIAERKNVLSLALFLGALLSYMRFAGHWEDEAERGRGRYYGWALVLFTGALLAKVTAYVFPPTVLLICWWKRGRIVRNDWIALLPFFVLSIGVGLVVSWVEKVHVGAEGPDWDFTFAQKVLLAGRALVFYTSKLLWPSGLCFMYPRWNPDPSAFTQWLYPLSVVVIASGLWQFRKRFNRGFFAGLFFFAGTVFPVLGFLNVYGMRFASVADHWVYVPSLGVVSVVVAGLAEMAKRWRAKWMLPVFASVVLPLLGLLTWREAGQYRDVETLWLTTIGKNPGNWMPYMSLGLHYKSIGRVADALARYQQSVALNPKDAIAYSNIGAALSDLGRDAEAIAAYRKALALGARLAFVRFNLGNALLRTGQIDESILELREALAGDPQQAAYHHSLAGAYVKKGWPDEALASYRRVIEIDPGHALAHFGMGNLLLKHGRTAEAVESFKKAISFQPDLAVAHANLAVALLQQGRVEESLAHGRRSVEIDPRSAGAYQNLGLACLQAGRFQEAGDAFAKAVQIDPALAGAWANLAWLRAACPEDAMRDGPRALGDALRADQLTGSRDFFALRVLAAAHAEMRNFADAEKTIRQAMELVSSIPNADAMAILQQDLDLYRAGRPLRIPAVR